MLLIWQVVVPYGLNKLVHRLEILSQPQMDFGQVDKTKFRLSEENRCLIYFLNWKIGSSLFFILLGSSWKRIYRRSYHVLILSNEFTLLSFISQEFFMILQRGYLGFVMYGGISLTFIREFFLLLT